MAARSHRLAVILHRKPLGPKSTATPPPNRPLRAWANGFRIRPAKDRLKKCGLSHQFDFGQPISSAAGAFL